MSVSVGELLPHHTLHTVYVLPFLVDTPRECTDNDIRLVNGTEEWNGRLEVCLHGHWGAVCEDRFENIDAAVACKNLGFSSDCKLMYSNQSPYSMVHKNHPPKVSVVGILLV